MSTVSKISHFYEHDLGHFEFKLSLIGFGWLDKETIYVCCALFFKCWEVIVRSCLIPQNFYFYNFKDICMNWILLNIFCHMTFWPRSGLRRSFRYLCVTLLATCIRSMATFYCSKGQIINMKIKVISLLNGLKTDVNKLNLSTCISNVVQI